MADPSPKPAPSYPPPATLSAAERAVVLSLPADLRARFEGLAGFYEFSQHWPLAQAEAQALADVLAELAARWAGRTS